MKLIMMILAAVLLLSACTITITPTAQEDVPPAAVETYAEQPEPEPTEPPSPATIKKIEPEQSEEPTEEPEATEEATPEPSPEPTKQIATTLDSTVTTTLSTTLNSTVTTVAKSDDKTKEPEQTQETTAEPEQTPAAATVSITIEGFDSTILAQTQAEYSDEMTVFSLLKDITRANKIQMEFGGVGSNVYIKGIDNLYEGDNGAESGWQYYVNGEIPKVSAGKCDLAAGDIVEWRFLEKPTKID